MTSYRKGSKMRVGERGTEKGKREASSRTGLVRAMTRLFLGLALSLLVTAVLVMAAEPMKGGRDEALLSQALLSGRGEVNVDSRGLASRMVEQKFQIHMEEMEQQPGEIPYVEVWVLNDPFYPLMGEVGTLRREAGDLASKEWQMLGFPSYEEEGATGTTGTTTGAPVTSVPSATPVTTGVTQRVVMVSDIYEIRGIRYADIKVNDTRYEKLKAGSTFAEVFKVQEIKDEQTVILTCGDEAYELKLNQLRKI